MLSSQHLQNFLGIQLSTSFDNIIINYNALTSQKDHIRRLSTHEAITILSCHPTLASLAWAIVIGIMQIIGAFTLPLGTGREWLLGLTGLLSIIFGILISMRPAAGLVTVIWLIGIYAIVYGVMNCVVYFQSRSLATSLS